MAGGLAVGPGRKFWRGRGRRRGFTVCQRARSGDSAQPSQVKRLYFSAYCVGGAIVLHDRAWRTGAAEAGGVAPPFIVINNVFSRSSARRVAATREFGRRTTPALLRPLAWQQREQLRLSGRIFLVTSAPLIVSRKTSLVRMCHGAARGWVVSSPRTRDCVVKLRRQVAQCTTSSLFLRPRRAQHLRARPRHGLRLAPPHG